MLAETRSGRSRWIALKCSITGNSYKIHLLKTTSATNRPHAVRQYLQGHQHYPSQDLVALHASIEPGIAELVDDGIASITIWRADRTQEK
jgi:hypothetical protein